MLHGFSRKKHETVKNSIWSELNHPSPSLSKRSTGCTRQEEGNIASCCLLPTCSVLAKSVTVTVVVQKVRVVLRQAWSKSQRTILMGYLTISRNVRRYQTHQRWQFFSFRKTAHRCIVCLTQSNCVKNVIFMFPFLTGSAVAQVIWGGIVKRLSTAYFIYNISAKKYQNPFTCIKVIASQRWDVFWDTVHIPDSE